MIEVGEGDMRWIKVSSGRQEGDDEACDEQGKGLLQTAKNVTVGKPLRCFALVEEREFKTNDLDLHM